MSGRARVGVSLLFGAALGALGLGLVPTPAFAYCRESIEALATGPCVETPGVPLLHWERSCLTYVFNEDVLEQLPMLTEDELRGAFKASYDAWRAIDCGDGDSPFYVEQAPGFTATDRSEFTYDERNEALVSVRTRRQWADLEHDPLALAITLLWHDAENGEILDVDMEFNTGAGSFTDCQKSSCNRNMMDLRNTVTHEAGHVLGLGHSEVAECTMLVDAPDGETSKRSLEEDDEQGYCALGLPQYRCKTASCECPPARVYPSSRKVKTCACTTLGARSETPIGWLGLLALVVVLRALRKPAPARR